MNSRFRAKREAPFDIAPGEKINLECELEAGQPGPFEAQLHVYLDDVGLREIVLNVRGEVQAANEPGK